MAAAASFLFAVHPLLTEAVSWVSGGPYSQSAFFFLLSFLLYILAKSKPRLIWISVVSFTFAVLSSEKALSLFLVFILFELSFGEFKRNWKKMLPYLSLGALLAVVLFAKISYRMKSVQAMSYDAGGMDNPLLQIPSAFGRFSKLLIWPYQLTLYETFSDFRWSGYFLDVFLLLAILGAIIYGYRKNKKIFFWFSFTVASLLPILTPFRLGWWAAERYIYIGSLGFFVLVAMLFSRWLEHEKLKKFAWSIFIFIILALSARTIARNFEWKNEDTLWEATAKYSEKEQKSHNNMGEVYARQGDMEKSVEEFKIAIEINPRYCDAYYNLSKTLNQMGKTSEAIENYNKAVQFNPGLWQAYYNMGMIFAGQERYNEAKVQFQKVLDLEPENADAKINLEKINSILQEEK